MKGATAMKTNHVLSLTLSAMLLFLLGCTTLFPEPTPTPPPTPTAIPLSSLNGRWRGTTSAGKPITFEIADESIAMLAIVYDIEGATLSASDVETVIEPGLSLTATTFSLESSGTKQISMNGVFESSTSASGDVTISGTDLFCGEFEDVHLTWTATKE
jgi:hypothetical protein